MVNNLEELEQLTVISVDTFEYWRQSNYGRPVSGPPTDTKLYGCSSSLYKMTSYLQDHIHPPVHFKSCLDHLQFLI